MKKVICILSFVLISYYVKAQEGIFKYITKNVINGNYEITLTLKKNKEFSYSEIDDQQCYISKDVSMGKWERKGENIILEVSDTLKPKVKIKETFLKKDTLTIFFKRMDECDLLKKVFNQTSYESYECYEDKNENYFNYTYHRDLHFYDKNNKQVFIYGLQNKEKIEIPINKKIAKIDFYFPNDWSPNSAKISVKVSENTGQIHINNLSQYLQENFNSYSFVLSKKHIVMSGFRIEKVKLKRQKLE